MHIAFAFFAGDIYDILLFLLYFFQFNSFIDNKRQRYYHQHSCQYLGYRKPDLRDQQLVCPEYLDPESSQAISKQIDQEYLAVKLLMLSVYKHDNQNHQAP